MKIGLLDFGIRDKKINSMSIIEDLLNYAIKADELGYTRLWLSEHHNFDPLTAWLSPEILLPVLAGVTDKLRIGSGGVLLRSHSPYRVAYTFKLLNNMYPDRIDLGVAKGYTSINKTSIINSNPELTNQSKDLFYQNLKSLTNYFVNEDELFEQEIIIPPYKGFSPEIWYLTGSYNNTQTIIDLGLNLVRSLFHHGSDLSYELEKLEEFKESFYKKHKRKPKICLAFSGVCNVNERKARNTFRHQSFGFVSDNIVGSPSFFEDKLSEYNELYGIDEFIFMNVALKPKDRIECIEQLSNTLNFN